MTNYITRQVKVTKLQHGIKNLVFAIDNPITEVINLFRSSMIKISGWVLYEEKPVSVIIKQNTLEKYVHCDVVRNDVISLLKKDAEACCGFVTSLTYPNSFKVGFLINDEPVWVATIDILPAPKILFGEKGHLFLDNDYNKSVEQYTGRTLIDSESLNIWYNYFLNLENHSQKNNYNYLFTLAPAKELVFPLYYPHRKGTITPVEQFLAAFNKFNVLYPLNELQDDGELTYWKLDTHWTDYGAGLVTNLICNQIGREQKNPFPFSYVVQKLNGDLGSKLPTLTTQNILRADFSESKKLKIFDNKIINRGWIQVYENPNASINEKVIVFGDSFTVNMVTYFVQFFKRVVHVLSGARIDYDIIEHESPDHVICEITTRFLIQPPEINYTVSDDYKRKIDGMSLPEQGEYINSLRHDNIKQHCFYIEKTLNRLKKTKSSINTSMAKV